MNFKSTFRVYLAAPLGLADTPVIITTAYATASGQPRAEWFLVLPEDKCQMFSRRNKLDLPDSFDDHGIFDAELLLSEALDQAVLRLRQYALKKLPKTAPLLLAVPTETRPSDQRHLVKLWLRGSCCGSLSEMRAKSECSALIETLVWIHGLPMLSSDDL
jgi:hypothetical protein